VPEVWNKEHRIRKDYKKCKIAQVTSKHQLSTTKMTSHEITVIGNFAGIDAKFGLTLFAKIYSFN